MTDETTTGDRTELDQGGEVVPFPTAGDQPARRDSRGAGDQADETSAGDDADPPVRVDPPPLPASALGPRWERPEERRPVLPEWVTDPATRNAAARWAADRAGHTVAYHAVRVPLYFARLAGQSPRGLWRTTAAVLAWAIDADSATLRRDSNWRGEPRDYLALMRARKETVQTRLAVLVLVLLVLAGVTAWLVLAAPGRVQLLAVLSVVVLLGLAGRRKDRPLLGPAVVTTAPPRLTTDVVVRALGSLGLAGINQALSKGGGGITFPAPITRDGPGWRAEVDLPYGVTVGDVAERREKLASGLRRPLGCVWPEPAAEAHAGRLVLWVGDRDMAQTKAPAWPLAKAGRTDLFQPVPFGTDQRGRVVTLTLMFASMVLGSIPRMGKTFALRLALLAAALDPRAELHPYDLKGTGDLSPLEPVAHRYRSGDEDEDIAYALADMRELQVELRRRAKVIRDLPRHLCPENKITPELAGMKTFRLHPIVLGVDECQRWFEHPVYGEELVAIAEDLVRRGPAAGIIPLFATQRPDAKSLPTGISDNAVLRFCLKVMGQVANDMVLGTSAYKNGVRATTFSRRDVGIGYLAGEGDDPRITRSYYVDGPAAEAVIVRARAMREKAGTLSGHALGQAPEQAADLAAASLLDDVLAVVPATEGKVWSETVVERLAELRPAVYDGWRPEQLTAALKPYGVTTGRQVWGTDPATAKGANRKGIHREDIAAAVAERDRRRRAG
jgi:DNA segregation ATPase FtsK/SpoIIIE, S-DNA-T family